MCELFAMSSRRSTALTYSLEEFSRNGSKIRSNRDGWGIAMARDRDVMLVKEAKPASDNIWVRFIADNAIETDMAIAHVRHATIGRHSMENTHPFRRVLGRRTHVFAHNGTLAALNTVVDAGALPHQPVGETDSELVFCYLLTRLQPLYEGGASPAVEARFDVFAGVCEEMRKLGPCNFLYHDGDTLFVHANRRVYEENGRLTEPRPPGLQMKQCWANEPVSEEHCPGLDVEMQDRHTILFASVPLDDEGWEPLAEGQVVAARNGQLIHST